MWYQAYLNVPVLGIALLGGAAAYAVYMNNVQKAETQSASQTAAGAAEGDDFDE